MKHRMQRGTVEAPTVIGSNATGIACMCAGVACLVANDACAKWLGQYYAVPQIIFFRTIISLPIIAAIAVAVGGMKALMTSRPLFHISRGLMAASAAYSFFLGLTFLPLAEATAIVFVAPLFMTAFSVILLKEYVGPRRWAAIVLGFSGVLIIVQPGAESFQAASLIVVITALLYAFMMIMVRMSGPRESIWTLMFYLTLVPALVSAMTLPVLWKPPELAHLPAILGVGLFGASAFTLMTQAFRLAPTAVVAPFDYTALIWATLLGWVVWGDLPGVWTSLGAACIVISGIYVIWREA